MRRDFSLLVSNSGPVLCRNFETGCCFGVHCDKRIRFGFKIDLYVSWCAELWATYCRDFKLKRTNPACVFPFPQFIVQIVLRIQLLLTWPTWLGPVPQWTFRLSLEFSHPLAAAVRYSRGAPPSTQHGGQPASSRGAPRVGPALTPACRTSSCSPATGSTGPLPCVAAAGDLPILPHVASRVHSNMPDTILLSCRGIDWAPLPCVAAIGNLSLLLLLDDRRRPPPCSTEHAPERRSLPSTASGQRAATRAVLNSPCSPAWTPQVLALTSSVL
jgi:hypothetical protein